MNTDLIAHETRRWRGGRRERPFRFLLDGRLFRLLCNPAQADALDRFGASLARLGIVQESGLPDLEMTPLTILDVLGVEPPRFPGLPYLPESMAELDGVDIAVVLKEAIKDDFKQAPHLEAASLNRRIDEARETTSPAAHELFDLCVTRIVSREKFEEDLLNQLSFDALFTFRFPGEYRARMFHLFDSFLLNSQTGVAGLTRVRRLKVFWDKSLERIIRKHPTARAEIMAVDQEMKPRKYRDFLGWEVIHHSVLGYARKRVHPVIAFTPEPEDRLRAKCKAHKTALRAFLDEISPEDLANELRPLIRAWRPGWLVPCREDGTLEAPVSTGEIPIWAGAQPPTSGTGAGEG